MLAEKMLSGITRESEQEITTANGFCPFVYVYFRIASEISPSLLFAFKNFAFPYFSANNAFSQSNLQSVISFFIMNILQSQPSPNLSTTLTFYHIQPLHHFLSFLQFQSHKMMDLLH